VTPVTKRSDGGAGLGGDGELADQLAALWLDHGEVPASREPDVLAVECHVVDAVDRGIGAVLAEDLRRLGFRVVRLHDPEARAPASRV